MDDLIFLRKVLSSPDSLKKLIGQKSCGNLITIDGVRFIKLPIKSSEPSPREVYQVQTSNKKKFFLKLNQYTPKIENEYRAYKFFRHQATSNFYTPEILDLQINANYGEKGQHCSWLIEEWLDGKKPLITNHQHFELSIRVLAQINVTEIDLEQAGKIFSQHLPNKDMLAESEKLGFLAELNRELPIVDKNISQEFSRAIDAFEKNHIPYTIPSPKLGK